MTEISSVCLVEFAGELQVIGSARGAAIPETTVRGGTLAHDVRIGRHTIKAPFATVRTLPPGFPTEPVLGTVLLRNFVMTFDFANARVRLDRVGLEPITLPTPVPRLGLVR